MDNRFYTLFLLFIITVSGCVDTTNENLNNSTPIIQINNTNLSNTKEIQPINVKVAMMNNTSEIKTVSLNEAANRQFSGYIMSGGRSKHHSSSNSIHVKPTVIVAFGDSITYGNSTINHGFGGYPIILQTRLPNDVIVNEGHPGYDSSQLLEIYNCTVVQHNPNFVIIMCGINDINHGINEQTTKNNIESLCTLVKGRGVKPILCTITPVTAFNNNSRNEITDLNTWILNYGVDNYITTIDFNSMLYSPDNTQVLNPCYDNGDECHLNQAAYELIGSSIDLKIFNT